jgi:hypothetical protein
MGIYAALSDKGSFIYQKKIMWQKKMEKELK